MTKKTYFLVVPLAICLALVSYKLTYGFFSDGASSLSNTFAAASTFPTPSSSPTSSPSPSPSVNPGDVVINEIWPFGNSDDEWVELFNKASFPIDISGWKITDKDNVGSPDTLPIIPVIPSGGFVVLVGGGTSTVTVPESAIKVQLTGTIGGALNGNNDGFRLMQPDNSVIDRVSWGNDTTFMSPSASAPANTESLARNPNGVDTNTAADWIVDSTPTIGVANP